MRWSYQVDRQHCDHEVVERRIVIIEHLAAVVGKHYLGSCCGSGARELRRRGPQPGRRGRFGGRIRRNARRTFGPARVSSARRDATDGGSQYAHSEAYAYACGPHLVTINPQQQLVWREASASASLKTHARARERAERETAAWPNAAHATMATMSTIAGMWCGGLAAATFPRPPPC